LKLVQNILFIAASITSTMGHSAESSHSFRALVNFGELEEIGETNGAYNVKTSEKTSPIEIMHNPSNPVIDQGILVAHSVYPIDYDSLAIFRERAAANFGFLPADVDVEISSKCKFRQVPYGDRVAFRETVSEYVFKISLGSGRVPVMRKSSIINRKASAACEAF
jgi:hypothetical protein